MARNLESAAGSARDMARWQKAQQFLVGGQPDKAAEIYQDLIQRFPDTPRLWYELGFAAGKKLDFELADQACQRAIQQSSNDVSMLILIGQQYHWLRRPERARECFERAAAAAPNSIHAQLSLADWYERERRLQDAWRCVEACVALEPDNAQVQCVQALLLQRGGQTSQAETLLQDIIRRGSNDANVNYSARHQLAVVFDQTGNYTEAFHWLNEAKDILRSTADIPKLEQEYDRSVRRRRELLAALTPEILRRWRAEGPASPSPRPLTLLGGHPRTGTTLLEQILAAHPYIAAFDEPMAFADEVAEKLAPMNGPAALTLKALSGLTAPQRSYYRQRYFKSLLREKLDASPQCVMIDKNPSPTAWLHLWLRLFPELKVIIALRDPRDVVVSCYFQNLRLNATNANFLSLERTALHYADLMDVWLRMRELGGFEWIETRYEDIVAYTEPESRRITEFLGLTWHPNQAAYHEKSRDKFVFSPTYNEATQPVYNRSVGRWRNYAEVLAPVQERLMPYCQLYQYE